MLNKFSPHISNVNTFIMLFFTIMFELCFRFTIFQIKKSRGLIMKVSNIMLMFFQMFLLLFLLLLQNKNYELQIGKNFYWFQWVYWDNLKENYLGWAGESCQEEQKVLYLGKKMTFPDNLNPFYLWYCCNFQNTFHIPAELFYQKNVFLQYIFKKCLFNRAHHIADELSTVIGKTFFLRLLGFSPCEVIQEIMPSGAFHRRKKKDKQLEGPSILSFPGVAEWEPCTVRQSSVLWGQLTPSTKVQPEPHLGDPHVDTTNNEIKQVSCTFCR